MCVYEPSSPPRVTLWFQLESAAPPLTIVVRAVRECEGWGFAVAPTVRVGTRFTARVRAVRFATTRSFVEPMGRRSVRVEVDLAAAPTLVFEGDDVSMGPIEAPPAPRAPTRPS